MFFRHENRARLAHNPQEVQALVEAKGEGVAEGEDEYATFRIQIRREIRDAISLEFLKSKIALTEQKIKELNDKISSYGLTPAQGSERSKYYMGLLATLPIQMLVLCVSSMCDKDFQCGQTADNVLSGTNILLTFANVSQFIFFLESLTRHIMTNRWESELNHYTRLLQDLNLQADNLENQAVNENRPRM